VRDGRGSLGAFALAMTEPNIICVGFGHLREYKTFYCNNCQMMSHKLNWMCAHCSKELLPYEKYRERQINVVAGDKCECVYCQHVIIAVILEDGGFNFVTEKRPVGLDEF